MDGGEGDRCDVRRPMNAFLIFCKGHRSIVREKNPDLDNKGVTRILADLWNNLKEEEKVVYTDFAKETKDDKSDILSQKNILYNENQKQKKRKVTQEMVWEAQLQYFKEQTATEIRRRQLMEVKENFYRTATAALKKSEVSDIFKIFNADKEQ